MIDCLGEIRLKTDKLMHERWLQWLAQATLDDEEMQAWTRIARPLQADVYAIDSLYEREEVPAPDRLEELWLGLKNSLRLADLDDSEQSLLESYARLRTYESYEAAIHCGVLLDPGDFHNLVKAKTADVSILRNLIWSVSGELPSQAERELWDSFDQCGELLEDAVDCTEDAHDWNFNFWLYAAKSGLRTSSTLESVYRLTKRKLRDLAMNYSQVKYPRRCQLKPAVESQLRFGARLLGSPTQLQFLAVPSQLTTYAELRGSRVDRPIGDALVARSYATQDRPQIGP